MRIKTILSCIGACMLLAVFTLALPDSASASGLYQTQNTTENIHATGGSQQGMWPISGDILAASGDPGSAYIGGMETGFAAVAPEQWKAFALVTKGGGSFGNGIESIILKI